MKKDRSLFITAVAVLVVHAVFLTWIVVNPSWKVTSYQPKKKLVAKTIKLKPKEVSEEIVAASDSVIEKKEAEKTSPLPVLEPNPSPNPSPKPKIEAKAKPKPKPKTEAKAKPKPKSSPKKEDPRPKKTEDPDKRKKLLTKAQESIAKIASSHDKIDPKPKVEKSTVGITSLDTLSVEEIGYKDELAMKLKQSLTLPEEGEVQIKLTLTRTGKVTKVLIMAAKSDKNKMYIETNLPKLTFPPFGKYFGSSDQFTFQLTLTNE